MRYVLIWYYLVLGLVFALIFGEHCKSATPMQQVVVLVGWPVLIPAAFLASVTMGPPSHNACEVK